MRAAILLLALAGCSLDVFGPDVRYVNREAISPPWTFAIWYADTERCLGSRGDYNAVRWFVADSIYRDGVSAWAILAEPHDITVLATHVTGYTIIRHEAAHHITGIGMRLHDADRKVPCESD